jgi:hypothetical protein
MSLHTCIFLLDFLSINRCTWAKTTAFMLKSLDTSGSTAFKKAVRSEGILASRANEARNYRVMRPPGAARDISDWLTSLRLRSLKWSSPMVSRSFPSPTSLWPLTHAQHVWPRIDNGFVSSSTCISWLWNHSIALHLLTSFASQLDLQFVHTHASLYSGHFQHFKQAPGTSPLRQEINHQRCVVMDKPSHDSHSQFVTAWLHTLTSCSLVPPK